VIKSSSRLHRWFMERTTMTSVVSLSIAFALVPACGSKVDLGEAKGKVDVTTSGGASTTEEPNAGGTVPEGSGGRTATGSGGQTSSGGSTTSAGGATPSPLPEVIDRDYGPDSSCDPISTTPWDFNPCGRTTGLEFSPDGRFLIAAMATLPPNVHVYRLADGARVRDFSGTSSGAHAAVLSPDGKKLAVCGPMQDEAEDPGTIVYDFETGEELYSLHTHSGMYVGDVAFSADGTLLATGGFQGPIEIWNASTGELVTSFDYPNSVHHLQFSRAGARLLVGGADGRGLVWDFETRSEVFVIAPIAQEFSGATFSPDGLFIGSTTEDNALQIHTAAAGSPVQTLPVFHQAYVSDVVWVGPDRLVTNDWAGVIASWKRGTSGAFGPERAWITKGQSLGIAVSPDQKTLVVGTAKGALNTDEAYSQGFVFLSL